MMYLYISISIVMCLYMTYLFLILGDKFLPGYSKYYLTLAWFFRKNILTQEGIKVRNKILITMSLFTMLSAFHFWL